MRTYSKKSLTKIPGTADFMPPEAQLDTPIYDTPLDVFSYGGVVLHTATQLWPTPSAVKQYDPESKKVRGFTEVERRQSYIDQMTGNAKVLVPLAVQCLHEAPGVRPSMIGVSETMKKLKDRSPDVNMNPMSLLQQVSNLTVGIQLLLHVPGFLQLLLLSMYNICMHVCLHVCSQGYN